MRVRRAALISTEERAARSSVLISAARLTRTRGDYAAARAHLEESLTIARTLGHAGRVGIVLYHLGNVLRDAGDVAAARPLFEESLAVGRALPDDRIACAALFGLGAVALQVGDDATAQAVLEDSVAIAQTTNRDVEVSALVYLGVVATRRGEFALACDRFAASLAANRPLGNQDYLATILDLMAGLPAAQGDYARALRVYGAVDALNERLGARLDALRQAERQHWLARAERALSRAAREAAWVEGRTMSPQEAVAGALAAAASSEPHE